MSNAYALISALIFAVVAIAHVLRLINRWSVVIGPYNISINVSWAALVVSALLAIWGLHAIRLVPNSRPLHCRAINSPRARWSRVAERALGFFVTTKEAIYNEDGKLIQPEQRQYIPPGHVPDYP